MKRNNKFYRKNEVEVMKALGLKPTKNSGSGWIEKEDGQNDNIICQLKSTDAQSIRINKLDLDKLEYNAGVSNKLPIFAIQFLQSNEVFLIVKPENILEVSKYIRTGKIKNNKFEYEDILKQQEKDIDYSFKLPKIKSSLRAKEKHKKEMENKYKKERKSAK